MTKISSKFIYLIGFAFFISLLGSCDNDNQTTNDFQQNRLQPYTENSSYWQIDGEPTLLISATDYHNIFQRPDLVEHLDLLQSVGGNYIRNTMASREILPDHRDLWPFKIVEETEDSLIFIFDLDQWNDEYWQRFDTMLEETAKRDMIVEVTIWERHDYYRTRDQAGWVRHPYNPANNINYSEGQSGFPSGEISYVYGDPASRTVQIIDKDGDETIDEGHPFFYTVPALENNEVILPYQKSFVDKILSYTLEHDHVIYNMNNETREPNEWGEYWGSYIQQKADEQGVQIYMTDMQDAHDVTDDTVARMMDSELFTFVDISQNNFQKGDLHWERIQYIRDYLSENPKPITNIKVYGTDDENLDPGFWGSAQDGKERFWRNIIGGTASSRFHRPPWGIGLNEEAQAHVRSMVMFAEEMDVFSAEPRLDLLENREPDSAWLLANPGIQYAVYFPFNASIDLRVDEGIEFTIRWLDIENSTWLEEETVEPGGTISLSTPRDSHWIAVVTAVV
jgi:hypothetical protein